MKGVPVFLLVPIMILVSGGCASGPPAQDATPVGDTGADAAVDEDADVPGSDWRPGPELPRVPECTVDDDCQGLAPSLGPCRRTRCGAEALCVVEETEEGTPCHSGSPCHTPGVCAEGVCQEPTASCEDGDPCTGTTCDPALGCLLEPLDGPACDDGNACTRDDACLAGECLGIEPLSCDDGNPCTGDSCDPWSGCTFTSLQGPCDDGDPCTGGDVCVFGLCIGAYTACECFDDGDCNDHGGGCFAHWVCDATAIPSICVPDLASALPCPAPGPCTTGLCDPGTDACTGVAVPDGTSCTDPLGCVAEGACTGGQCVGVELTCEGGGGCLAATCVPGQGCSMVPADGPCDDGDTCTVNDWCQEGACAGLATGCAEATGALFRITSLSWTDPPLAWSAPGLLIDLDPIMDVSLQQALNDAYQPLDLAVGVSPMDVGWPDLDLWFGTVSCVRDGAGVITACAWPVDGLSEAWLCLDPLSCGAMPDAPPPPAFGAAGVVSPVAMGTALEGVLVPSRARVRGRLEGLPDPVAVADGVLELFLPEVLAGGVALAPPLVGPISFDGLLPPAALTVEDGVPGWWLRFAWEGTRVPGLP